MNKQMLKPVQSVTPDEADVRHGVIKDPSADTSKGLIES